MSSAARPAVLVPVRNAADGSQKTERPIAKPIAVGLAAAAANQRPMVERSAAFPRMIWRHAALAAIGRVDRARALRRQRAFDLPELGREARGDTRRR